MKVGYAAMWRHAFIVTAMVCDAPRIDELSAAFATTKSVRPPRYHTRETRPNGFWYRNVIFRTVS